MDVKKTERIIKSFETRSYRNNCLKIDELIKLPMKKLMKEQKPKDKFKTNF